MLIERTHRHLRRGGRAYSVPDHRRWDSVAQGKPNGCAHVTSTGLASGAHVRTRWWVFNYKISAVMQFYVYAHVFSLHRPSPPSGTDRNVI